MSKNVSGAIWSLGSVGFSTVIYFIFLSQASKYLDSQAFGIFAIISMILVIGNTLQDFGFSSYLIIEKTESTVLYNSLFTINLLIGGVLSLLTILGAYPLSYFFKDENLFYPILFVSPIFLFSCLGTAPISILNKHLQFKQISLSEIISRVCSFILAYYLLVNGYGVYSLIVHQGANLVLKSLFLLFFVKKIHPFRLELNFSTIKPALKFGSNLFGSQLINQCRLYLDGIILGRFLGTSNLGVYSLSKELVIKPLSILNPVIRRLALPNFAMHSGSPEKLASIFSKGLIISSLLFSVSYYLMNSLGVIITNILYNKLGVDVYNIFQILFLLGIFRASNSLMGPFIQSINKPELELKWNLLMLIILPLCLMIGVNYGVNGTAITMVSIQFVIVFLSYFFFLKKYSTIPFYTYLKNSLGISILGVPSIFIVDTMFSSLYVLVIYTITALLLKKSLKKSI